MDRENTSHQPAEQRIGEIIKRLHAAHPDAHCELDHQNPFELLVATILSAQCTDVRVNMVTPDLFARFPNAEAMAGADIDELETLIKSTGFFRNKSKNIMGAAQRILTEYDGEVPADMDALLTLPGVARKTANVVMGNAFREATGVVVDTHVKRLSNRLGLTTSDKPEKIEKDLIELVPQS
ncbi:MAG: endonuclease III, partial [Litorilinea sp.]